MAPIELHAEGLRRERLKFGQRALALPITLFCVVLAAYASTTLAILKSEGLLWLVLIPLSGVLVVMLFVISHDACHQSFTSSRALNNWIGRIGFLPALHAFSLWDSEHNRRHHHFNNIRDMDYAWIPWSPREFAQASAFQRWKYRFYREPGGVFFYYLFEIWPQRKIFPRRSMVGTITPVHILDTMLLWAFVAAYAALLIYVGGLLGRSATESVFYALAMPFLIFTAAVSFAIFLHHTHYHVPWYSNVEQWKQENGALYGTVHVVFPWIVRKIFLQVMEHNAHHVVPSVPLYNLEKMQHAIALRDVVEWNFSLHGYFKVCRRCKLFDYERGLWTNYRGKVTSGALLGQRSQLGPSPSGAPTSG